MAIHEIQRDDGRSTNPILTVRETSTSIHNYYYSLIAHATRRGPLVRPFVTGGGGGSAFVPPSSSGFSAQGETKAGGNYGGGIKFLLSEKHGIRFDVRDHVTCKPFFRDTDGKLHNLETSMTFLFVL